jgi:hypothetical protein
MSCTSGHCHVLRERYRQDNKSFPAAYIGKTCHLFQQLIRQLQKWNYRTKIQKRQGGDKQRNAIRNILVSGFAKPDLSSFSAFSLASSEGSLAFVIYLGLIHPIVS